MKETPVLSSAEKKELRLKRIYLLLPLLSLALLFLLWILAATGTNKDSFPSPLAVWERFLLIMKRPVKDYTIFGHVLQSLRRIFSTLVVAWITGISFGVLTGWNRKADALLSPLFTAFRSVPPLAWIPLITIWFGTGEGSQMLIVYTGCIASIVVNTQAGLKNVAKMYLDVGTVFNASSRQMLFQIAIPSALDAVFAGVRTSTSAAWMVVLAAEMLGGKSGVGFLIVRGMDSLDLPLVLMSMIFIGVVGAMLAVLTQIVEGVLCPWTRKKSA
ncbi:MAG: ABC transporter permease [Spirochaetia bacterium]|nr:ABC transporter permease [Spirochaetia bacterium]